MTCRPLGLAAGLGGVAMLLASCAGEAPPVPGPAPVPPAEPAPAKPLEGLLVDGCAEVLRHPPMPPRCAVWPGSELTLWAAAEEPATWHLRWGDGQTAPVDSEPADDGRRARVQVPDGPPAARLLVRVDTPSGPRSATLLLAREPDRPPAFTEAKALRRHGRSADALALVERALPSATEPSGRGALLGLRARLLRDVERPADAHRAFVKSLLHQATRGAVRSLSDDAVAAGFLVVQVLGRPALAELLVDAVRPWTVGYPAGTARLAFIDGHRAERYGRSGRMLRPSERALGLARRLGIVGLQRGIQQLRASVLAQLGRYADSEAAAIDAVKALPAEGVPCKRARALANVAVAQSAAAGVGLPWGLASDTGAGERALATLEDAWAYMGEACQEPGLARSIRLDLARHLLAQGRLREASAHLAALDRVEASLVLDRLELSAAVAWREGRVDEALQRIDELSLRAAAIFDPRFQWRAAIGRGVVMRSQGRDHDAIVALEAAERALGVEAVAPALGEGRLGLIGRLDAGAMLLVEVLIQAGRWDDALARARRARVRRYDLGPGAQRGSSESPTVTLARERYVRARTALDAAARDDWQYGAVELARRREDRRALEAELQRALDAVTAATSLDGSGQRPLRRLAPGEVGVFLQPVEGKTLALVFEGPGAVVAQATVEAPGRWPAALAPRLEAAEAVVLMAHASVTDDDPHRWLTTSAPLAVRVPVTWSLDLGAAARGDDAHDDEGPVEALVVGDSEGTLAAAVEEAEWVRGHLHAQGWAVEELPAGQSTDLAALHPRLSRAQLFHFAGHGAFREEGELHSHLRLGPDAVLRASDVVALPRAPRRVCLAACEAADEGQLGRHGAVGLGLAQAFVSRGSEAVLSPTRRIDDALARQFVRYFYEAQRADRDWATAYRAAVRAVSATDPDADWAAFRIFVP